MSANSLTQAIVTYLNSNGWKVWRSGNHAVYSVKRQAFMKNPQKLNGIPDILGYCRKTSRMIAIEIKYGKDRITPEQERFLHELNKSGGVGIVARTFDGFLATITTIN